MPYRIITFLAEWDEDEGPIIVDAYPKSKKLDLEDITMQIFSSFQTVFGYSDDVSFDRTNLVLPLKSYKRTAKILLDTYRSKQVRGGRLPFIIAFLVPLKFVQRELHVYNEIQEKIVDHYSSEKEINLKDFFEEIFAETEHLALNIRNEAEKHLKQKFYWESIEKFRESIFLLKLAKNREAIEDTRNKMGSAITKYAKEILNSVDKKFKEGNHRQAEKDHRLTVRLAKEIKDEKLTKMYSKKLRSFYIKWIKELEKEAKPWIKGNKFDEALDNYQKIQKLTKKSKDEKLINKYNKKLDKLKQKLDLNK